MQTAQVSGVSGGPEMKIVFLAVFFVSTAVHLYASLRKDTRLRNITKPFILLSLLGFYVLAARSVSTAVVLALLFSWLGDVLLMPKGNQWFVSGGVSFLISHILFISRHLIPVARKRMKSSMSKERALTRTALILWVSL